MGISGKVEICFKFYPHDSAHYELFLLNTIKICQEFELMAINFLIVLQFGEKVSKTFKNYSSRTLCKHK